MPYSTPAPSGAPQHCRSRKPVRASAALVAAALLTLSCSSDGPVATLTVPEGTVQIPMLTSPADQNLRLGSYVEPIIFANSGGAVAASLGCVFDRSANNEALPPGLSLDMVVVERKRTCQITGIPSRMLTQPRNVSVVGVNEAGRSTVSISINVASVIGQDSFSQLSLGRSQFIDTHSCAVNSAGALYCWGDGDSGQLGLGQGLMRTRDPYQVGSQTDWESVSAGAYHSCAKKTTGELFCWGYGFQGQLGLGSTQSQLAPAQVSLSKDWAQVSAGLMHTCAVNAGGELYCWGEGGSGQLGLGGLADRNIPVLVGNAADWAMVSAGSAQTCAIKTSGQLWCWGTHEIDRAGTAVVELRQQPVRVGTASDWASVSVGSGHSCALSASGALSCWGYGGLGQLGLGNAMDQQEPTRVGTALWSSVSVGVSSTCAVRVGGQLFCWGDDYVAMRSGMGSSRNAPAQVGTASDWQRVEAGEFHACAAKATGLQCWGDGARGQLGLGSTAGQNAPS